MLKFQPVPIEKQEFVTEDGQLSESGRKWLSLVANALSGPDVPPTTVSAGTPIQIRGLATDGNFLYVCVGVNSWKRVALNAF